MPRPKTSTTHYHAQLKLQDKGCAIKELVFCRKIGHIVIYIYTQDLVENLRDAPNLVSSLPYWLSSAYFDNRNLHIQEFMSQG